MRWIKTEEELPELKRDLNAGAKCSDIVLIYAKGAYWLAFLVRQENESLWCWFNPVSTAIMTLQLNQAPCWAPIPMPPEEFIKKGD